MRTFVGFGFGPIQAGLFLAEAHLSGHFGRLVVAEVVPEVVEAVRRADAFTVNIGHADHIEALTVHPVETYRPQTPADRAALVAAVAEASAIATALPSVEQYAAGGQQSAASILAEGLRQKAAHKGSPAVVYTAENNTRAAELLAAAVLAAVPPDEQAAVHARVQFLDTIIGKMSGVPEETHDLAPLAPGLARAYLVEAFNRILVTAVDRTRPGWGNFRRGIDVFVEKPDLQPFAEAKLYGHNAGHALAGYLAHSLGMRRIDELRSRPDLLKLITDAMVEESGVPLCRRYAGVDPLFSPAGFAAYAAELVVRMVNPYVRDTVARVGRDPARKLGWDDRLVGAMRLALAAGVAPQRYATGAAAALDWLDVAAEETEPFLGQMWAPDRAAPADAARVCRHIVAARRWLHRWAADGYPVLETAPLADTDHAGETREG